MASPPSPIPSTYACDTLPAPQNLNRRALSPSSPVPITLAAFDVPTYDDHDLKDDLAHADLPSPHIVVAKQPPARKLCVRHQRMADEGTIVKLQSSLDALPFGEREAISAIWSSFSSSPHPRRGLILQGILTMCCFSQLSLLSSQLAVLIRLDPFARFPREVSLKVLGHLDAMSLGKAAQVNRHWKLLADDDVLWMGICEQHINKKCRKCGWGLPLLENRRITRPQLPLSPAPSSSSVTSHDSLKRGIDENPHEPPPKRHRSSSPPSTPCSTPPVSTLASSSRDASPSRRSPTPTQPYRRPWKHIYCERLKIARNWRNGIYTVRTLHGHTDGIMCLQFSETLPHPSFPVLISGSYDRTARVWNMETGEEVRCLRGHTRAVRALQFDAIKLITGSMDCTLKVWDWRTGRCIRTLEGHSEGVVCLRFDEHVLASGSVDTTVKVWNFRTGECFTLRGHKDWVNSVALWQLPDAMRSECYGTDTHVLGDIEPGKMLFTASDDGTIRLWDLHRKTCMRQFIGHVGQVQSIQLLNVDCASEDDARVEADKRDEAVPYAGDDAGAEPAQRDFQLLAGLGKTRDAEESGRDKRLPLLISGSLDNTIKVWDIETGKATQTLFGHIEGVWAVASDKLRIVSGSHDRTIRVWVREEQRCTTIVGHKGAVTCLALSDDKIVSGSDDYDIKIWSFAS